jgi:hypothetical protein
MNFEQFQIETKEFRANLDGLFSMPIKVKGKILYHWQDRSGNYFVEYNEFWRVECGRGTIGTGNTLKDALDSEAALYHEAALEHEAKLQYYIG